MSFIFLLNDIFAKQILIMIAQELIYTKLTMLMLDIFDVINIDFERDSSIMKNHK